MTNADELRNRLMQKAAAAPAQNSTLRVNINPQVDPTKSASMQQLSGDLLSADLFDDVDLDVPQTPPMRDMPNPAQPISPAHPMPFSQNPQGGAPQMGPPVRGPVQPPQQNGYQAPPSFADPMYSSGNAMPNEDEDSGDDLKALGEAASQSDGNDKPVKLIVGGVIAVLILAVLVLGFVKQSKSKDTATTPSVGSSVTDGYRSPNDGVATDSTVVVNESLNYSEDLYTDMITISKHMTLDNGVVSCYFSGTLAKYNRDVTFEVTPEEYNAYSAGDTLEVSYRVAKFGGVMYCVDIQVI